MCKWMGPERPMSNRVKHLVLIVCVATLGALALLLWTLAIVTGFERQYRLDGPEFKSPVARAEHSHMAEGRRR